MKGMVAFGLAFFSIELLASIAFWFIPAFNKHPALRWTWLASAVGYAVFVALFISVWRRTNDCIEITNESVASHSPHGRNIMMKWGEIAAIEESLQGACLKLRSMNGETIRVEYQTENLPDVLNLLERNLEHLGNNTEGAVFRKRGDFYAVHLLILVFFAGGAAWACTLGLYWGAILLLFTLPTLKAFVAEPCKVIVEPARISIQSTFRHRIIDMSDIRDVRLDLDQSRDPALAVLISGRRTNAEIKLIRFKNIFHLHLVMKHNHERTLDS
ncbi:hypothetical protein SCARR_00491 [Pontiella sulfatireligans]|uniref:Uncharacterized protein n=2 Tax=Pontiella sulfatireligans TaxID=2750658 RepID=A0A6C2UE90_9BACT|nr:hypothetical protein SCARR_00491 [Pontiella sulfatireligans]